MTKIQSFKLGLKRKAVGQASNWELNRCQCTHTLWHGAIPRHTEGKIGNSHIFNQTRHLTEEHRQCRCLKSTHCHTQTNLTLAVILGKIQEGWLGSTVEFWHHDATWGEVLACGSILGKKTDNIYLINAGKRSQSCLPSHNIKKYLAGKVSQQ